MKVTVHRAAYYFTLYDGSMNPVATHIGSKDNADQMALAINSHDYLITENRRLKERVKRLRAANAEQSSAIVPAVCSDHVLGSQTETCSNCFAAVAFRRY